MIELDIDDDGTSLEAQGTHQDWSYQLYLNQADAAKIARLHDVIEASGQEIEDAGRRGIWSGVLVANHTPTGSTVTLRSLLWSPEHGFWMRATGPGYALLNFQNRLGDLGELVDEMLQSYDDLEKEGVER